MNGKQIKLAIGITLAVQSVSCFFLTLCYLCSDKKRTAAPFAILGFGSAIAGIVLLADKIKEFLDIKSIRDAVERMYGEGGEEYGEDFEDEIVTEDQSVPTDETATESEFC